MLPNELLVTRRSGNRIKPAYVAIDGDHLTLAEQLIAVFGGNIGKKRSQIQADIDRIEHRRFNFKLIRGMAELLARQAIFAVDSPIDPRRLRDAAFMASRGFAVTEGERLQILESVAREFNMTPSAVENHLWSDLEDEQVLKSFIPVSAADLIMSYNLSLAQTLLFRATYLEFRAVGNWKRLFRSIKRLGLMYSVERNSGDYLVSLEGPAALLKLTERYGTNLAKLLPEIVWSGEWSLRAQIVSRWQKESQLLTFELGSAEGVPLPQQEASRETNGYDSSLERSFARRFSALGSRWRLLREPEPIPVGTAVMIPDFGFELGKRRIFLEIVGFWTPEYLARKISKLSMVRGIDLMVAVDSQLGVSHKIPGKVIAFEGEVPLKPILEHLERVEREELGRELEALSGLHIAAEGEYLTIGDLATKHGVSNEAILRRLALTGVPGYTLVGECLIKDSKLEELREAIEGESSFTALILRLETVGITDPYPLLQHFGYQVRWQGLNQDSAVIVPPKGKK